MDETCAACVLGWAWQPQCRGVDSPARAGPGRRHRPMASMASDSTATAPTTFDVGRLHSIQGSQPSDPSTPPSPGLETLGISFPNLPNLPQLSNGANVATDLLDAAGKHVPTLTLNARRKFFHALTVVMFVPGVALDVSVPADGFGRTAVAEPLF